MDLSKINTHQLQFDPTAPDFISKMESMGEFVPRLWPANALDKHKLFAYIVLMYDLNCNLREIYPGFWHRKRQTALIVGFEMKGSRFQTVVEHALLGKIEAVNRMAVRYVTTFNNPAYLALMTYYEMFVQETAISFGQTDSDSKKKQAANIRFFNENIKELSLELFGGKESEEYCQELYKTAISDILGHRAELVAERIQDGEPPTEVFYDNLEDFDD